MFNHANDKPLTFLFFSSGLEKWAHFRPTVVAQILVGMLRAEVRGHTERLPTRMLTMSLCVVQVGTEPISAKAVVVNEEMLSALDADKVTEEYIDRSSGCLGAGTSAVVGVCRYSFHSTLYCMYGENLPNM